MNCLGLIKNKNFKFRRCKRQGNRFFCDDHSWQPLGWLFALLFTGGGFVYSVIGNTASIVSLLRSDRIPEAEHRVPTPEETSSGQPVSSPLILPTPKESATPVAKAPDKSNRNSQREIAQSSHVRRARTLYRQGKYQEALGECDAELRVNPHNNDALKLRGRIKRTIQILNRQ